jgi:RimJ/RimL family protein N-acetyltransferase
MASHLVFDDKERVGAWVAAQTGQTSSWGEFYAMGIEQDGTLVAGIVFHQFNDSNAVTHIAVTKPSKRLVELLRHAANYAFNRVGLLRLTGLVTSGNIQALRLDLHLGWELEFTMKSAGARGEDMHVLVMWPDKCRWLERS